jgi:uncharacterized Zn-binding protein involved in type VI secretion
MPGIARDAGTDVAGGAIVQGSGSVFVNGSPVARVGDAVAGHGRGPHRSPVMAAGSSNVFANGISVCRAGDPASCGHPASGSGNVFAN